MASKVTHPVQQLLRFLRLSNLFHPFGHRPVGDDLSDFEQLIAPYLVRIFMRVNNTPRHVRPYFN
jgi:hypothetical protein